MCLPIVCDNRYHGFCLNRHVYPCGRQERLDADQPAAGASANRDVCQLFRSNAATSRNSRKTELAFMDHVGAAVVWSKDSDGGPTVQFQRADEQFAL